MADLTADEKDCLQRVLVAMIAVDADIAPEELETAQRVYRDLTGDGISEVALRQGAEAAIASGLALVSCIGEGGANLELEARYRLFGAAFAVASADGFVLEEEDALLANVAAALKLTQAQYRGQIERLTNQAD